MVIKRTHSHALCRSQQNAGQGDCHCVKCVERGCGRRQSFTQCDTCLPPLGASDGLDGLSSDAVPRMESRNGTSVTAACKDGASARYGPECGLREGRCCLGWDPSNCRNHGSAFLYVRTEPPTLADLALEPPMPSDAIGLVVSI